MFDILGISGILINAAYFLLEGKKYIYTEELFYEIC